MGALDDDDAVQLEAVAEWSLPTDRAGFFAWLKEAGVTLAEFRDYPAYLNMPESLQSQLVDD